MIGPSQLVIVFLILLGIFFLGYALGKKSGYIKRIKETEQNKK